MVDRVELTQYMYALGKNGKCWVGACPTISIEEPFSTICSSSLNGTDKGRGTQPACGQKLSNKSNAWLRP